MAHIEFLDETLRDGQQSLWGMRMQACMALPATKYLDKTGFRVIDLTGSHHFEVLIRHCRENPWAMMDALVEAMPRTTLRSGMRSNAAVSFGTTSTALRYGTPGSGGPFLMALSSTSPARVGNVKIFVIGSCP